MENIKKEKAEIRKEILGILRCQGPVSRGQKSLIIQRKVISGEDFRKSKVIMTYVSMRSEVDTTYLIEKTLEEGKRVVVPYVDTTKQVIVASELISINDLVKGPFGIRQPKDGPARKVNLKEIDLIMVPGIAFDKKNMRLGRGKGYYDRFLAEEDLSSAKRIGLAFSFQIVDSLPSDPHDMPVSQVITD